MLKSVNMVVVGDEGVGKTSLITTLVSSYFPAESVPSVLQQVHIAPEDSTDNVPLCITDTSSLFDERVNVLEQIENADVVVLVYAANKPESFQRVKSYWMDEVISKRFSGPVVIVGNKIDLKNSTNSSSSSSSNSSSLNNAISGGGNKSEKSITSNSSTVIMGGGEHKTSSLASSSSSSSSSPSTKEEELQQRLKPLLQQYKQIVAGLECSAMMNVNVSEVFYLAQHAVVYPTNCLFDPETQTIMPAFRKALVRVFRIFDKDHDHLLSDTELNDFQETCFGARLQVADIEGVKNVLKKQSKDFVLSHGITLEGFLYLNSLFILRHRAESSWLVLKTFGYDRNLNLDIPASQLYLGTRIARDQNLELTKRAITFLSEIFQQYDVDQDGALSSIELEEIFKICDQLPWKYLKGRDEILKQQVKTSTFGNDSKKKILLTPEEMQEKALQRVLTNLDDFPNGITTNAHEDITLNGWIAQWVMMLSIQPKVALTYFRILGYSEPLSTACTITRRKSQENGGAFPRNTIRGFVFGDRSVGKSSLLRALVHKQQSKQSIEVTSDTPRSAVNKVKLSLESQRINDPAASIATSNTTNSNSSSSVLSERSNQMTSNQSMNNYLILTEVPTDWQLGVDALIESRFVDCDLAIIMFDVLDASTLEYAAKLQEVIPYYVPCVYLANKTDKVDPDATDIPPGIKFGTKLCDTYSLPPPEPVCLMNDHQKKQKSSSWLHNHEKMFELLFYTANHPEMARPISEKTRKQMNRTRIQKSILRITLVASITFASFALYRYLRKN